MKKVISVLLAAIMIFSMVAFSVSGTEAATSGACGENVTWSYDESTKTLTISGNGKMSDYEADMAYTYPWVKQREKTEKVVIGNGVTSIGDYSFYDFEALTSVTIPGSVTSIGREAFSNCILIESINIPDGVIAIDSYVFEGCTSLKNITLPESVTSIGTGVFWDTSYYNNEANWKNDVLYIGSILLEAKYEISGECQIQSGTRIIAENAFSHLESLTGVTIPQSVTIICGAAFVGCPSLTEITVDEGNPNYSSVDGVLFNKAKTEIICYPAGAAISYTIPNGVTEIGACAFLWCKNLTKVIIPESVKSIGDDAFDYCISLKDITISDGVTSIGAGAFNNCDSLESLVIPKSVKSIGEAAFANCQSLKDVYYTGTEEEWKAVSIGDYNYSFDDVTIHYNYNSGSGEDSAATITSYKQGDVIEFGWYPQSEVTDSEIIAALNAADGEWISYGYYSGTGSWYDGKMTADDYMRYKDVIYGSDKYRGVVFDTYRPFYTGEKTTAEVSNATFQAENGYYVGTVYWFKYEPIKWRVLDPDTGMVMSETLLDSQAYNNYILYGGQNWGDSSKTYYCCDYSNSSIRKWLNEDFYNTAFSTEQQDIIAYTALDNSAYDGEFVNSAFDSENTNDKIYLLSYDEAINTDYGFDSSFSKSDIYRQAQGSDYAKCQGLSVSDLADYAGNSYWLLRTPGGNGSDSTCDVEYNGYVNYYNLSAYTYMGVRPVLNFVLDSEIFQSDVSTIVPVNPSTPHTHSYSSAVTTNPGCETAGVITYSCACGDSYITGIAANGHSFGDWQVEKEATASEAGTKIRTCTVCGKTEEERFEMPFFEKIGYYIYSGMENVLKALTDLIDYLTVILENARFW